MIRVYKILTAATLTLGTPVAAVGDPYVGFDVIGARSIVDFGGTNTSGGFSNSDEQGEYTGGVALQFGMRDLFSLGELSVTPEVDFAWYDEYNTTSASFPGLPAPTFFYNSSIETARLGVNLWAPFHEDAIWRAEAGVGVGVLYRDVSTTDTVVQGSKDDYVAYGQLGLRFLRKLNEHGNIALGASYLVSDSTSVPLTNGFGAPAGNLDIETDHVEISIGYQFSFGK